jgi:hypothetical protein
MRLALPLTAFACLSLGVALQAADPPSADADLKRLAGGATECATWELQLDNGRKDQSLRRVTLTFHKTRLGASVTPIYVATLAADHANGSAERGFSYRLELSPTGRFVVGSKGAVLAEDTRIPYAPGDDMLDLGDATATLPKVGAVGLKGKWKKVEEK